MGIFGKAVDARTSQVLRNEFGFDVEFDFVAAGVFKCDPLEFSIKPFMAAVGNEGVFFINQGRVVLTLLWSGILSRKQDIWGKGSELQVAIPKLSRFAHPKEFPNCYWHKAEIAFNKSEDHDKFLQMYYKYKFANGLTEESLALHDEWMKCGIGLPISQEKYLIANQHWGTEETRLDSYRIWGLTQDAQRFLYFVGRSVCKGLLPGVLIQRALSMWLETEKLSTKYTGTISTPSEALIKLMEDTEILKNFQGNPDSWGIGSIDVDESEWKSEIPTFQRLVAFDLHDISGNFIILPAWSDFHSGSQVVFTSLLRKLKNDSLNFVTGNGLVTIPDQERSKFSGLVQKLS